MCDRGAADIEGQSGETEAIEMRSYVSEVYVSPEAAAAGAAPHFDKAGRVHDWRNHVPEGVQAIWSTFSAEQRAALVAWADHLAGNEEWE